MKYIRTKDGVYEIEKDFLAEKNGVPVYESTKCPMNFSDDLDNPDVCEAYFIGYKIGWIKIKDIIKQADTIDELCDEAVFFDKDNKPHYKSQEGNIWYLGAGLFTETLRFGVFTDKGLIYVAKMNDEGELELL